MDWQIHCAARSSTLSGETFEPGERIQSVIFLGESGELRRADFRDPEAGSFRPGGPVIARWARAAREHGEDVGEKREQLASAEELFFGLLDSSSGDAAAAAAEVHRSHLLHLLSLYLERKRILRPVAGGRRRDWVEYRHPASGRTFSVAVPEVDPEVLTALHEQLDVLVS